MVVLALVPSGAIVHASEHEKARKELISKPPTATNAFPSRVVVGLLGPSEMTCPTCTYKPNVPAILRFGAYLLLEEKEGSNIRQCPSVLQVLKFSSQHPGSNPTNRTGGFKPLMSWSVDLRQGSSFQR